ncbi:GNAT family N-acetyltransferase [Glycomyces albidus]|uniref:Lysine N-acyltransferase MbtK n=1 Tax=Glycomyces albidus TaxID=2656774 RepID=A0A6L5GAD9_9ACTN|nr:GNAT family N-acetyltransferase [Glycomyces albidus]MQM26682.1 GNAT family N-acetyltransferase [Glycomyces albidus]
MSFTCYRDAWGIPHLRAPDALSLSFAQGWNAATDRAWQLENLRRRATGTAAALHGDEWLPWDRLIRQVRVTDTAVSVFEALDLETREWVAAFVDGVNAGSPIAVWEPWTPLAVWHAEHLTFGSGFPAKLWRRLVRETLGEDAVARFAMDGPEPVGSNGWLVSGEMTASGAAIVAGDPHRFIQLPGSYQQIRLACDEFDVVGLAIPGVPGIAHFGHAGGVAWGITNAMADTQDLFREQLRRKPDGTVEAFGPGGWEPVATRTETIAVAGGAEETVEILETARGPVIADGPDGALSLRGPVNAEPDLGFAALPKLLRAKTVADIDAALDDWVLPVNVVMAADTAGGLLHRVAGRVPERDGENLKYPVFAWDERYAWRGWKSMPRKAVDRVATMANDRGIASGLGVEFCPPDRADRIRALLEERSDWAAADMARIHTDTWLPTAGVLLDLLPGLDLGPEAAALRERLLAWDRHMDASSTEAAAFAAVRRAFIRGLAELPVFGPLTEPSGHPAFFTPWLALLPRIGYALRHVLDGTPLEGTPHRDTALDGTPRDGASLDRTPIDGDSLRAPADSDSLDGTSLNGTIPDRRLVDAADRDALLAAALEQAARQEPVAWGEVHRLAAWHDPSPGDEPVGPLAGMCGDGECVLSTSGAPGASEDFLRGPAARWVWDLADREQSRWIVPFGAAGEPGPHQCDQFPLWQRGELVKVVTDWQELQEEYRMIDRPAVFEQKVDGFGHVAIVPVRPAEDLDLIYGWVTEDRAKFWGMTGHSKEYVLEIYEYLDSLETHHAFLVLRDREPIALFQTYEPDADPVGECYEVEPGDIGAHLLVASANGKAQTGFTGALMGVLALYLFDDPAHRRVVVEPDVGNAQAAARLQRSGFTLGPEIELREKRARLAFLRREDAPCGK